MTMFLQGIFAILIIGTFLLLLAAMAKNSGRHSAEERAEEDRREYFQQGDLARRRQTWRARG